MKQVKQTITCDFLGNSSKYAMVFLNLNPKNKQAFKIHWISHIHKFRSPFLLYCVGLLDLRFIENISFRYFAMTQSSCIFPMY